MKSIVLPMVAIALFLASCQKSSPPGTHYAHGFCLNDGCECKEGYTGDQCSEMATPISVELKAVEVLSIPEFHNGESWDAYEGYPDVACMIANANQVIYEAEDVKTDIKEGGKVVFTDLSVQLVDVLATHKLRLLDIDVDQKHDIIKYLYFTPFNKDKGFPETIDIKEGEAEVRLHLKYHY